MTAVDTNILVRIVVRDTEAQVLRARALLRRQDRVFVPKTVLLEFEWVLRGGYDYTPPQVLAAIRELLDIPNVEVEDEVGVAQALRWYEAGMDFADALHVASAAPGCAFATFDIGLQRAIRRLGICKAVAF